MLPKTTPKQLATPTDLSKETVTIISESLNLLIADAFALYIKIKGFHWHVSGAHFSDYHKLFDEQAEQIFGSIDILAERVRKIGKLTIRSIGDIQGLTDIQDSEADFLEPMEMIKELLSDNENMRDSMREAIDTCEENGDKPTANILQSLLDETEKRIWFLFEITQ